jgi:hypothetical protein
MNSIFWWSHFWVLKRSNQPLLQPRSATWAQLGDEKIVCEFLLYSVKIRTGREREKRPLQSVLFQLLFAHTLCNYTQWEDIFHSHTSSIFHTKLDAGRQLALESFNCVVDRTHWTYGELYQSKMSSCGPLLGQCRSFEFPLYPLSPSLKESDSTWDNHLYTTNSYGITFT